MKRGLVLARAITVALVLFSVAPALGADLTVACYNTESGDADPDTVARNFDKVENCDLWGLCEVQNQSWARTFERAAERARGKRFSQVYGKTGRRDRLVILYNEERFELVNTFELDRINPGYYRSALVARLKDRETGHTILFMVNHLARGKRDVRHDQARKLNAWARQQTEPVIAVGDYNFDYSVSGRRRDRGFDEMTDDRIFEWVKPDPLERTHSSPRYDSVLDFVFTSGEAKRWRARSWVVSCHADDECGEDRRTSDHFPVAATFEVPRSRGTEVLVNVGRRPH